MKALFLAAGVATLVAAFPATASVFTIGSTFARSCYEAADARHNSVKNLAACDRAFAEQQMSEEDRFATHVNRGILRSIGRHFTAAESDFKAAMALNANHPEPWLNMGILRYNQGNSAAAMPFFERALQLGTSAPEIAYYGRGLANEDRGNVKAAYADLVKARTLKPGWAAPALELQRYQVRR